MLFTQPGKVVEGGVNTAVMVETVALQRILLLQFIPVHLPVSEVDRNRRDHIAGIQLPGIGDIVKTFGIDFKKAQPDSFSSRRLEQDRLSRTYPNQAAEELSCVFRCSTIRATAAEFFLP